MVSLDDLYEDLVEADIAWNRELRSNWGPDTGKAKFDARSVATPLLRSLHEKRTAADEIYRDALAAGREPLRGAESIVLPDFAPNFSKVPIENKLTPEPSLQVPNRGLCATPLEQEAPVDIATPMFTRCRRPMHISKESRSLWTI